MRSCENHSYVIANEIKKNSSNHKSFRRTNNSIVNEFFSWWKWTTRRYIILQKRGYKIRKQLFCFPRTSRDFLSAIAFSVQRIRCQRLLPISQTKLLPDDTAFRLLIVRRQYSPLLIVSLPIRRVETRLGWLERTRKELKRRATRKYPLEFSLNRLPGGLRRLKLFRRMKRIEETDARTPNNWGEIFSRLPHLTLKPPSN